MNKRFNDCGVGNRYTVWWEELDESSNS